MKNLLIFLVSLLTLITDVAAQQGTQYLIFNLNGQTARGKVRRNEAIYPLTTEGFAKLKADVESPTRPLSVSVLNSNGTLNRILPALSILAPSWIAGFRYSYAAPLLTFEGTAGVGTLKFVRLDGTGFTTSNPDGVPITSGQEYGPGPTGETPFSSRWQLNYSGSPLVVTAKQANASATYSYTLSPVTGANRVVLTGGTSTTTTPPTTTTTVIAYSKVLFIGNSIMFHGPAPQLGWTNSNGMAASAPEADYVHQLTAKFQTLNPSVTTRLQAGTGFELNFGQSGYTMDEFDEPMNQFQPDFILLRLGENVSDGEVNGSRNMTAQLNTLLDKITTLNAGRPLQIVATTGVWSTPNWNAVVTSVCAARGIPVIDLTSVNSAQYFASQYADAGVAHHPNDAGMQRIADLIWAGIPKNATTATNTVAVNKPSFDTFDYSPIPTNQYWPVFDSRLHRGVAIGDKVVLDNGVIRVEIWRNFGGSPAHISVSGGSNIVNQNDWGRGNGMTIYRGGRTRQVESQNKQVQIAWATPEGGGVGNNPIQVGDTYDHPSVAFGVGWTSTSCYTKSKMMNWAVDNDETDVTLEQWVRIDGRACFVNVKLTHNRTGDVTFYEARSNEYPNVIVNAPYKYNAHVNGSGQIEYLTDWNQTPVPTGENWFATVPQNNINSVGLGLWRAGGFSTSQKRYAPDDTATDEFANPANYGVSNQHIIWDWNGIYYSAHAFIVGTVGQIRDWANAQPDPRNKFSWKFNSRNGRGYFYYSKARDTGFPTPDTGVELTPTENNAIVDFHWPQVAIPASTVQKVYVHYKASSTWPTSGLLIGGRVGQNAIQVAGQQLGYSLVCNDTWQTLELPVSNLPGWYDKIQEIQLTTFNVPWGAKLTIQWINTVNADPEP